MKVAVCEINAADRKRLCALIRMYCDRHSLNAEIEEFASGSALLRALRQAPAAVVFMDVLLGAEDGLAIARLLREQHSACSLFFCTASREHALEAYELNALHYLLKPVSYQHVKNALDRCGDKLLYQASTLLVSLKPELRVLHKDILFVEIYDKNCHIHTAGGVASTRRSIEKLQQELGSASFLRCHRSFIVNLAHVRECEATDFVMDNGARVPIRQAGRARLKQAFREYAAGNT